jgi:hypothetical protein
MPVFFTTQKIARTREDEAIRDNLSRLFERANNAEDMDESFALYTEILEVPNLKHYFSREEIADVRYNRSANHTEIADFYLQEKKYHEAQLEMRLALSDAKYAEIYYVKQADKDVCSERLKEYEAKRQSVIGMRKEYEAALVSFVTPGL